MENHNLLRVAILQQATRDYQTALKKNDTYAIEDLEKWFVSDWAQLLSGYTGELIIQECRKRAKTNQRYNRYASQYGIYRKDKVML